MTFYGFVKFVVNRFLRMRYSVQVIGSENFPMSGGVLLCSNHISNWDPPLVGVNTSRPVHFMAKEELFRKFFLRKLFTSLHAFPVKRKAKDTSALRTSLKLLEDGHVLGIFPEGTRSKDSTLGKGRVGAGYFALKSNAQVVPCAIIGPYKAFKPVKLIYGKPIDMLTYRKEKMSPEDVSQIIMKHIGLLIEENR